MTVLDTNPFLSHSDGPTTKLIIGNVLISVANSEIEKGLKELDVCLRSPFKEETYRDSEGRTTPASKQGDGSSILIYLKYLYQRK